MKISLLIIIVALQGFRGALDLRERRRAYGATNLLQAVLASILLTLEYF